MDHAESSKGGLEISVVVPVYRSASTLEQLCQRLISALESARVSFEIILVEDCGPDNSWEVVTAIASKERRVRGIRLTRNFGQHAATLCGISLAEGKRVVTIDDDLEQRPEDIARLLEKAGEGCALVYGVYQQRSHSIWRNATSALARRLFRIAIPSLNYEYTSFRVIEGRIARALAKFDSPFPFIDGYLSWLTNDCAAVAVEHDSRQSGTSTYTVRKLLTHTINIFVTFSDLPLRLASWFGLLAFLAGMIWFVFIVVARILGGITVSGFSSLMAGITLFGGVQLLILGVMGEYLSRVSFKAARRPLFHVAEDTCRGG